MKVRIGAAARSSATSLVIFPARYGSSASWSIFSQTGAMMKNVKNKDNPMMIWLDGAPCRERAERTKESTMTIRVKHVISKRIEGASVSIVMMATTLIALSTSAGLSKPVMPFMPMLRLMELGGAAGAGVVCAWADAIVPSRKRSKNNTGANRFVCARRPWHRAEFMIVCALVRVGRLRRNSFAW